MASQQSAQADLEAILASITDGFFVFDEAWRFAFINERAEKLWRDAYGGFPGRQPLLGEHAWDAFPSVVGGDLYEAFRSAVREGVTGQLETYVAPWEQWLEIRAYPFTNGLAVCFTDISKYKRTEDELLRALQEVTKDTAWFSRSLTGKLAQVVARRVGCAVSAVKVPELTKREKQVLQSMAKGHGNAQVAAELGLAEQTVRNYLTHLYSKLGVHSRAEAVVWARERGLNGP